MMSIGVAPASAKSCPNARALPAEATLAELSEAVTCLLNAERRKAGLRRLQSHKRLEVAAAGHARDMRDEDYFSHTSLDGRSFADRIGEARYYTRPDQPRKLGETLAWGTGELARPAELVARFMASPPHRAVIVDGDYRDVGIGLVRGTPTTRADGVTLAVDYGVLTGGQARRDE